MNPISIPLIVLTWNSGAKLREWLTTVKALNAPKGHVIRPVIVDNASSDITPAIIGEAVSNGQVLPEDVHLLPSNFGFAKAHNIVFRHLIIHTSCRFVATLNEDATADPGWLASLVDAASESSPESRIGMWSGPIYCPSPRQNIISSAGHWLRQRDGAFLDIDWNKPAASDNRSSKPDFRPFCPCFAASLWSLDMMKKVGLPDSDQFMYYDDVDLGYHARLDGWDAQYVDAAHAFHPLPKPQANSSLMRKHQDKGRLSIVCRYLPDQERVRILSELPENLRLTYSEMLWERRRLEPVETPDRRLTIWKEWAWVRGE